MGGNFPPYPFSGPPEEGFFFVLPATAHGLWARSRLFPIILKPRRAETGEAMLVDGALPGQEFVERQSVTLTRLLDTDQAATDSGHDLGLSADDPTLSIAGR